MWEVNGRDSATSRDGRVGGSTGRDITQQVRSGCGRKWELGLLLLKLDVQCKNQQQSNNIVVCFLLARWSGKLEWHSASPLWVTVIPILIFYCNHFWPPRRELCLSHPRRPRRPWWQWTWRWGWTTGCHGTPSSLNQEKKGQPKIILPKMRLSDLPVFFIYLEKKPIKDTD